ncbi:MAG: amidase [Actinomycetota bacterium]|nr:amidase [Actinomycetota bacterium]
MPFGSAFSGDFVSGEDGELVRRHRRAGLIITGKTNAPEFGILPTTEPHLFGACYNPLNMRRTTGGSLAAMAAGIVPMAHANDGGGSIRIPASCCGLFGLKPTQARNPLGPGPEDVMSSLVMEHIVTRSVRDSAALLDATSGLDLGDSYWAPTPVRPFLQEVGADPGRLRIAFHTDPRAASPVHDDCVEAVYEAVRLCRELGHEVEERALDIDGRVITAHFIVLWSAGLAWSVDGLALATGREPPRIGSSPLPGPCTV